jgi:hypothetical protein
VTETKIEVAQIPTKELVWLSSGDKILDFSIAFKALMDEGKIVLDSNAWSENFKRVYIGL